MHLFHDACLVLNTRPVTQVIPALQTTRNGGYPTEVGRYDAWLEQSCTADGATLPPTLMPDSVIPLLHPSDTATNLCIEPNQSSWQLSSKKHVVCVLERVCWPKFPNYRCYLWHRTLSTESVDSSRQDCASLPADCTSSPRRTTVGFPNPLAAD